MQTYVGERVLRRWGLAFFSVVAFMEARADPWAPGPCGADGFCTIISVQHSVEQRNPQPAGVVVGTLDDDGFKPSPVNAGGARKICRKEVRVPRVVHDAVTKMFSAVIDKGVAGALPPSLTPSEQTMLLYYNTIMQQTMNFQCDKYTNS